MKNYFKSLLVILTVIALLGVTTARAQFYSYNSFINGFNMVCASTTSSTTATNSFGGTNIDMAFGVNAYVYPGTYAASANNSYIGTNTIITGASAFGLQTNTGVIVDARLWPDNNSDLCNNESLFVSICGVNNTTTNVYVLTFASVVTVPIQLPPPSPNLANFPAYPGSGTITNDVASSQTQNQFTLSLTANGLTPVNVLTNWPNAFMAGAHKARLLSVTMNSTNTIGYFTNTSFSTVLTNGVWQSQTNTTYVTNWGGVYVNAGNCGWPPFHSP